MTKRRGDAYYRFFGTLGNSRVITRLHPVVYRLTGGRGLIGHEAGGAERDRLWARVVEAYPGYDLYQRKTTRRIPVIVLEPR